MPFASLACKFNYNNATAVLILVISASSSSEEAAFMMTLSRSVTLATTGLTALVTGTSLLL